MKKTVLKNDIPLLLKENKNTPRIALCLTMSINYTEKKAGEIALIKALLFQGTKTKSAEELANILENNGIGCYVTSSADYLSFKLQCLNEDFKLAVEILKDIVFNSTFEEFEKERVKIKGEALSDLDSPQAQAFDEFSKTIFANHPYGNTRSKILQEIDDIEKDDVKDFYNKILTNSKKNISVVGDFSQVGSEEEVEKLITDNFSELTNSSEEATFSAPVLESRRFVSKTKKDSAQAQIVQGWLFPSMLNEDSPSIAVMNTILGSSGLSSRLFLELREKKGLAYTVRSCYDTFKQCGCLWVYIGTNPVNMQTAVDGFKTEIDKMKNTLVSEEELLGGKNNILGKRQFILETNMQQAFSMSLYEFLGVGYDYESKYQEKIMNITAENVKEVANKYFTKNSVLSVLAPNVNIRM